jgi:hypothetical protein
MQNKYSINNWHLLRPSAFFVHYPSAGRSRYRNAAEAWQGAHPSPTSALLPGRYTPVDIRTGTLSLCAPYNPKVPTLGLVEEDSIVCCLVEAVYFRVATLRSN